jgi:hypothetical protein
LCSILSGPKEFTSVFYSLQNWRVRCYISTASSFLTVLWGNQSANCMCWFWTLHFKFPHVFCRVYLTGLTVTEVEKLMHQSCVMLFSIWDSQFPQLC